MPNPPGASPQHSLLSACAAGQIRFHGKKRSSRGQRRVQMGDQAAAEPQPACRGEFHMFSQEHDNKDIVRRWLVSFWGERYDPQVVEDFAAPDMILFHTSHMPRRGHIAIRGFMGGLRAAFPDFHIRFGPDLVAERQHVAVRWRAHGVHTGTPAEFAVGLLPAATGRGMDYDGISIFCIEHGRIARELGLADGVAAFRQLGLMRAVRAPEPFE